MKILIILSAFAATLAHSAGQNHEEVRELRLDTAGISELDIHSGAGSLDVRGVAGANSVLVTATVVVPGADADEAAELTAKYLELDLVREGNIARLTANFASRPNVFSASPRINLDVRVPRGLALRIDDGSGEIDVQDMGAAVVVDDGSGAMTLRNITGPVKVDDGSGAIRIEDIEYDVQVVDGSGSINIRRVNGSVTVDDGSGSIDVHDVAEDLVILDDGTGSLNYSQILGKLDNRS